MRIAKGRGGASSEQRTATFTGRVWADPILGAEDGVGVTAVFFEPGARTHWHAHEIGQVLHVTHGQGWIQVRNGPGARISAGDVVHIGPGEVHWHGAGPDSYMLHVAVSLGGNEWLEPVAEDDYASAFGAA